MAWSSALGRASPPHRRQAPAGGNGGGHGGMFRDKLSSRFAFFSALVLAYTGITVGLMLWNGSGDSGRAWEPPPLGGGGSGGGGGGGGGGPSILLGSGEVEGDPFRDPREEARAAAGAGGAAAAAAAAAARVHFEGKGDPLAGGGRSPAAVLDGHDNAGLAGEGGADANEGVPSAASAEGGTGADGARGGGSGPIHPGGEVRGRRSRRWFPLACTHLLIILNLLFVRVVQLEIGSVATLTSCAVRCACRFLVPEIRTPRSSSAAVRHCCV